ncbi:MAG: precorrin-6y C5,15-methyltransferase (decarboxylating) subunit CbiE [Veillonellaceae bacterium]|nr:precorrin-6y C5,15-methyltransferase (decarboxylating) subunit CbiE [Veillonellaceae bacterium]MDD6923345.1 precorrin-6y C5,15-methyltransferase (decarboxylating) subunit CbiE [Veillonellaceae bacterium]
MGHHIIIAGIGPGNKKYILPAAIDAIQNARVLVGGKRAISQYASDAQTKIEIHGDIASVVSSIRRELEHEDVVIMVSGDPGYYSMLDVVRKEFSSNIISVIPGISSIQYAFSRLALPWHDAVLTSFHGRLPQGDKLIWRRGMILGTLTDGKYTSKTISRILLNLGWPPDAKLYMCERLSYPDESIHFSTIREAAHDESIGHCVLIALG